MYDSPFPPIRMRGPETGEQSLGGLPLTCRSSNWLHCTLDRIWQSTNVQRLMCPAARRTCRLSFQLRCLFVCFRMYSSALYVYVYLCVTASVCVCVWESKCACVCSMLECIRILTVGANAVPQHRWPPRAPLLSRFHPRPVTKYFPFSLTRHCAGVFSFRSPPSSLRLVGSRNFNYISHNLRKFLHTHNKLLAFTSIRCLKSVG